MNPFNYCIIRIKTNSFAISIVVFALSFLISSCDDTEKLNPIPIPVPEAGETIIWKTGETIIVEEDLIIDSVALIIEPGVNIKIKSGCNIYFGNFDPQEIIAEGIEEMPINFTTWNPENDPDETHWGSIIISNMINPENQQIFRYCNFIRGGDENAEAAIVCQSKDLIMENCRVVQSKTKGILVKFTMNFASFKNNSIAYTHDHPISVSARYAHTLGYGNHIDVNNPMLGIEITSGTVFLEQDTTVWRNHHVPYIIGSLVMEKSGSNEGIFTLEKGTGIRIKNKERIIVEPNATLIAKGTADQPVKFTSASENPQSGNWKYIIIKNNATANFDHCIFEYGGLFDQTVTNQAMFLLYNYAETSFEHCTFQYSEGPVFYFYHSGDEYDGYGFSTFKNNTFINLEHIAIKGPINVMGSIDKANQISPYPIHILSSTLKRGYMNLKKLDTDYFVISNIGVGGAETAILEIEPGVTLHFDDAGISTGYNQTSKGQLIAKGTDEAPIIFTSAKGNPSHGDWDGLRFNAGAIEGTILKNCLIEWSGNLLTGDILSAIKIYQNTNEVTIQNCSIEHSAGYGILVTGGSNPIIEENSFYDNLGGDIIYYNNSQ